MIVSEAIRTVIYLAPADYAALEKAAAAAGEPLQITLRNRLISSLTLSQTAARSGCAGDGEVPRRASPELAA